TNPGVGFIPISEDDKHGALIWFKSDDKNTTQTWVNRIDDMLYGYYNKEKLPGGGRNQVVCSFEQPPKEGQVCMVPIDDWTECNRENNYGYSTSRPCIFLKLNR
ncbi:unnamed protein product, partial [Sphagnum compactum]